MPSLECWQRTISAQIVTQEKARSASQKCHGKFSMVGEHRVSVRTGEVVLSRGLVTGTQAHSKDLEQSRGKMQKKIIIWKQAGTVLSLGYLNREGTLGPLRPESHRQQSRAPGRTGAFRLGSRLGGVGLQLSVRGWQVPLTPLVHKGSERWLQLRV